MPYSGFFRRALAFIIDLFIISLPTTIIFAPMVALQTIVFAENPNGTLQTGLLGTTVFCWQLASLLVAWLYFTILESGAKQSTWGKRILGIKVVGATGERISFGRATGRFFCKSFLSPLLFQVGFIMAAFTNRKRALHDMIAEPYVVKKDFEAGQELPTTKTHWSLLIITCIVWGLCVLAMGLFTARATLGPTQIAAQNAAGYLNILAQEGLGLRAPQREPGVTYFSSEDGYRAVVVDPISNKKFTLFLKNGPTQACCEAFPSGDCAATGFEECK